jgi:Glycosyl hydrolase family 115/Gylcosyl hydrolase family 115 C-terminal domain/Viral BACON domain
LEQSGHATPLLVSDSDWPGVIRAVNDLSEDVKRVTEVSPEVLHNLPGGARNVVLVGTIGKSSLIDDLVKRHKLDVSDIAGKWEAEVTTIVDQPMPGVARALVVAGSDKRGTIYGIYDLSEQIGVSPWYWWADVRVPHENALYVTPGRYVQGEPAVKYRGIFFNDEAPALTGWVKEKYGNFNSQFYTKVFELLLRLKANYLWPAMWNNAFAADDPINPKLADEYGIVMSTSHEEPMMRAEKEWTWGHHGAWNYATNAKEIDEFWRAGMERNKSYEQIVTLGMRGVNDTPMSDTANTELLEKIVADQRSILQRTVNPDVTKVPQVWALYKEVQGYYEKGMRVPDDVTLLWSDDNWGNLRRLPTEEERKRPGGAGIYYHFDYVGGPRSYKWLNTNPIPKVQEQMNLALAYGANRIWVVNVGDGKPMEFPIEFFLSFARTPERWNKDHLHEFTQMWAEREFGPEHAEEIAHEMEVYTRFNGRRKPELIDPTTFSLTNYGEADRVEAEWKDLEKETDALAEKLPADQRASYFELLRYPIDACANLTEMYISAARNAAYARVGDPMANVEADRVRDLFAKDESLSKAYNHDILNGRWDHMMDQTHIGYTTWSDPPVNAMPAVTWIQVPEQGALGVSADSAVPARVGDRFGLSLGTVNSIAQEVKRLKLFDKGKEPVDYKIATSEPWLVVSSTEGTVKTQQTISVQVNWSELQSKDAVATVTVSSVNGNPVTMSLHAVRISDAEAKNASTFVESDGYVSVEAADTAGRTSDNGMHWEELPGYGETQSAMSIFPVNAASEEHSGASLQYNVYLYESGDFQLQTTLAPTMNFVPGRGLRFAVSVDDGDRLLVDALEHNTQQDWTKAVQDGVRRVTVPVRITQPGVHRMTIWAVDPGLVLERFVLSHGPLRPSTLGPPESLRAGAETSH